jgi:hypothetical protein
VTGDVPEASRGLTQDVHLVQQRVRPAALDELFDHFGDQVDAAGGEHGVKCQAQVPCGQRDGGDQRDRADDAELHHQPHPGPGPAGQHEVVDQPEDGGLLASDVVLVDCQRGQ